MPAIKTTAFARASVRAEGTIGLTRMIRLAGKLSLPVAAPLFPTAATAARRVGVLELSPDFRRLLRYGRAVDTDRLVSEVGYQPQFDAVGAIEDYVSTLGGRRIVPPLRRAVAR